MFVVIGLYGGILEDAELFHDKDKALDFIQSKLAAYDIVDPLLADEFDFDREETYWSDDPDMCENELFLLEVEPQ